MLLKAKTIGKFLPSRIREFLKIGQARSGLLKSLSNKATNHEAF